MRKFEDISKALAIFTNLVKEYQNIINNKIQEDTKFLVEVFTELSQEVVRGRIEQAEPQAQPEPQSQPNQTPKHLHFDSEEQTYLSVIHDKIKYLEQELADEKREKQFYLELLEQKKDEQHQRDIATHCNQEIIYSKDNYQIKLTCSLPKGHLEDSSSEYHYSESQRIFWRDAQPHSSDLQCKATVKDHNNNQLFCIFEEPHLVHRYEDERGANIFWKLRDKDLKQYIPPEPPQEQEEPEPEAQPHKPEPEAPQTETQDTDTAQEATT